MLRAMKDWIMRSWFRHPLSLRPFFDITYNEKGVEIGLSVASIWDEGWHANTPLIVAVECVKWTIEFGIVDSN